MFHCNSSRISNHSSYVTVAILNVGVTLVVIIAIYLLSAAKVMYQIHISASQQFNKDSVFLHKEISVGKIKKHPKPTALNLMYQLGTTV